MIKFGKITIFGIVIFVITLVIFAVTDRPFIWFSNVRTDSQTESSQIYQNIKFGFSIRYPQDWQLLEETEGIINSISFGQKKNIGGHGYDGEWFIFVYDQSSKTAEDIIQSMGIQFGAQRQEKRETITVGGLPAIKAIVTTPTIPDWLLESVIVEQNGKIYLIHNGAIKNDLFDEFYGSFKLL